MAFAAHIITLIACCSASAVQQFLGKIPFLSLFTFISHHLRAPALK